MKGNNENRKTCITWFLKTLTVSKASCKNIWNLSCYFLPFLYMCFVIACTLPTLIFDIIQVIFMPKSVGFVFQNA